MAFIQKKIIIFCLIFCAINTFAQSQLVVYQVKGNATLKETKKKVFVGSLVDVKSSLTIANGNVILLDNASNMYQILDKGTYSFHQIKQKKIANNSKSVSKRYLSYVYKKFLKIEEKKSIYGAVFRGNEFLNSPENYAYFTSNSFVNFNWNSTGEKEFYLWIINTETNNIAGKYRLDYANSLGVLLPLKKGVYKWTVTTENSLDSNKVFNVFEIVSEKEFHKREKDTLYKSKKQVDLLLKN
ncbi:hypothetical protein KO506_08285 [Polaribacter vadi]|uniref:hypothetical protein n=1 Tax=Polaribacter TaxID=52959 RepID=UPI001C08054F|nr:MULTISPECIES: hypothetical protein [Polaribacter]MBU3011397.1 hypothetical protein [Polaribacter vadi]MDO6741209.1 hypothetical protein [Polaribacter sp. 1_MG-2023]